MVKNIVFDFGGVLVDWNRKYVYDEYFGDLKKSQWFLDNVCTLEWNNILDGGTSFDDAIADLTRQFPEYSEAIALYKTRYFDMLNGQIPGMYEVLADLKARGVPMYGLTNWSQPVFNTVRRTYPVFDLLDGIVVSSEEKVTKPDPRLYQILFDRYSIRPEESVFIDDRIENVHGAEAVGMQAIHFYSAKLLRIDLNVLVDALKDNPI
jgi:2-haloacid dehalogenase